MLACGMETAASAGARPRPTSTPTRPTTWWSRAATADRQSPYDMVVHSLYRNRTRVREPGQPERARQQRLRARRPVPLQDQGDQHQHRRHGGELQRRQRRQHADAAARRRRRPRRTRSTAFTPVDRDERQASAANMPGKSAHRWSRCSRASPARRRRRPTSTPSATPTRTPTPRTWSTCRARRRPCSATRRR